MLSRAYANVKAQASPLRLRALIQDLKSFDCRLPLNQQESRIEFDISDCNLWWIMSGGLNVLMASYEDVVTWTPEFHEGPVAMPKKTPALGPNR